MYMQLLGIDVSDLFRGITSFAYNRCSTCDLGYFVPPVSGNEPFYRKLQELGWYYQDEKNEYDYARRFIRQTDDVLEIGCGKGAFAKLIDGRSYVGLEFSREAQLLAVANGFRVLDESIQGHCVGNAQAYDVVCAFQVLEHVTDPRSFIASSVGCLRPGGRMILSTPSVDSFASRVPNFILDMPPHHLTRWSDASFKKLADLFELELVELWHEPLHPVHRQFYAQTVLVDTVMRWMGRKCTVWDDSLWDRFVSLLCRLPAYLFARCSGPLSPPRGISVVAVYRKI